MDAPQGATRPLPRASVMQREEKGSEQLTLVLLPGLDGTGRLFQPFLRALPRDVRTHVVAYPPSGRRSIEEYARLVASQLPEGQIVLLAESFSGLVALALLASGAVSPQGVVFCASFAEPPRPRLLGVTRVIPRIGSLIQRAPSWLLRQFAIGPRAGRQQVALLRAVLSEVSPEVVGHRLRLLATHRALAIEHAGVPCCYLQGKDDRLVPSRAARWFESHFTPFQLEQLKGPHFLLLSEPQECARRVVRFLEELAARC